MNTTDEVEALPADVAALAAEADLGPHTLTCLPKRLGGIIGVTLMLVAIPMTWVAGGKIMTAVARDTYGWELVLYAGPAAFLLFVCVQILNPRSRHVRFYGFARGFILRDGCMRLTHVSWAEIVRVRRLSVTRDSSHWYELSATGGWWSEVHPSVYRRSYEVDTYMVRGARARGLKIDYG
jgi:hypothetical protein